jgi:hypothetical protein
MPSQDDEKLYALFYETVLIPYNEYKTIRTNRRFGTRTDWNASMLASTSAYHFREHLPDQHKKSYNQMVTICPDYALLRGVVNAVKHRHLTRGDAQIVSANSIREWVVVTIYLDDQGEYRNAAKSIEITLKDGTTRELFDVLTNVVNMWISFFQAAGISNKAAPFPHEDRRTVIAREKAGEMDLAMVQGISFGLPFKIQKYNYEKGLPEPVDLSGGTATFSIYDPRKAKTEVEMQAISPNGKKYVGTVELDQGEKNEFYSITDEEKKQELCGKLCNEGVSWCCAARTRIFRDRILSWRDLVRLESPKSNG